MNEDDKVEKLPHWDEPMTLREALLLRELKKNVKVIEHEPAPLLVTVTCRICGEEGHPWWRCGND